MKHTTSYKFNPDRIKSVDDIISVANEHNYYWCNRSLFMTDGSVHKFIGWDADWFEYKDLDDILRVVCDYLYVLKDFVDDGAVIKE